MYIYLHNNVFLTYNIGNLYRFVYSLLVTRDLRASGLVSHGENYSQRICLLQYNSWQWNNFSYNSTWVKGFVETVILMANDMFSYGSIHGIHLTHFTPLPLFTRGPLQKLSHGHLCHESIFQNSRGWIA